MRRRSLAALTLVAHVLLAAAVRRDARANGRDPTPWTAAILGGGLFGLAAYAATRE